MSNVYRSRRFMFIMLITCIDSLRAENQNSIKDIHSTILEIQIPAEKFVTTPLHEMVVKQFDDKETKLKNIEKLLVDGADVNAQNEDHRTPLWLVTFFGGDIDIITLLIKYGADITIPDLFKVSPLHNLVTRNNTEAVAILMEAAAMMKPGTVEKMITLRDDAEQSPFDIVQTRLLDESSDLQK